MTHTLALLLYLAAADPCADRPDPDGCRIAIWARSEIQPIYKLPPKRPAKPKKPTWGPRA